MTAKNDVAPLKYAIYKGISGKHGAVQFSLSQPHFYCSKNRKHKFFTGEIVSRANFSSEKISCPHEGCDGTIQQQAREGAIFIEMAPPDGQNKYDWSKKIAFALGLKDIGQLLIAMKLCRTVDLTHDPGAGTDNKGAIIKKLSYFVQDKDRGAILSLSENRKGSEEKKQHRVPLTLDEVTILATLLQAVVPTILAWV